MSDAKARHFKPHGRFPFVTSIWWRLNNSAREQAQGAQPPHTTARAPVGVTPSPASSIETPRRLRGGYSFLPFRYPFDTLTKLVPKRNLSLSYSRISHLQPSHPPFHDVPHATRSHPSCAIGLVKPPLFQPPTFKQPPSRLPIPSHFADPYSATRPRQYRPCVRLSLTTDHLSLSLFLFPPLTTN